MLEMSLFVVCMSYQISVNVIVSLTVILVNKFKRFRFNSKYDYQEGGSELENPLSEVMPKYSSNPKKKNQSEENSWKF